MEAAAMAATRKRGGKRPETSWDSECAAQSRKKQKARKEASDPSSGFLAFQSFACMKLMAGSDSSSKGLPRATPPPQCDSMCLIWSKMVRDGEDGDLCDLCAIVAWDLSGGLDTLVAS
jgi:hypothetical protein